MVLCPFALMSMVGMWLVRAVRRMLSLEHSRVVVLKAHRASEVMYGVVSEIPSSSKTQPSLLKPIRHVLAALLHTERRPDIKADTPSMVVLGQV